MRYKRFTAVFAAVLALAVIAGGCGASGGYDRATAAASSAAPQAAPAAPAPAPTYMTEAAEPEMNIAFDSQAKHEESFVSTSTSGSGVPAPPDDRKIVKRSNMDLETKDFDAALSQILAAVTQSGGYIENQSVSGQSMRYNDDYYERSADISARIPSDKLAEVTGAVGGICNVTSHWEGIEDITSSYIDVDARLKSLQLQEERLLDILSKAESLEDVITLEAKLSDVRYEIESLTASLRRMDSQVAYSYLNMHLREVVEYQQVNTAPKSFSERISDAFGRSGTRLSNFFEDAVIFVIEDLPLLLINCALFALVVFVVVKVILWLSRKLAGNHANKPGRLNIKSHVKPKPEAPPENDSETK